MGGAGALPTLVTFDPLQPRRALYSSDARGFRRTNEALPSRYFRNL
jgi:hypothetical protein